MTSITKEHKTIALLPRLGYVPHVDSWNSFSAVANNMKKQTSDVWSVQTRHFQVAVCQRRLKHVHCNSQLGQNVAAAPATQCCGTKTRNQVVLSAQKARHSTCARGEGRRRGGGGHLCWVHILKTRQLEGDVDAVYIFDSWHPVYPAALECSQDDSVTCNSI